MCYIIVIVEDEEEKLYSRSREGLHCHYQWPYMHAISILTNM